MNNEISIEWNFRSWITMRTHEMLDHWTKAIKMLAPDWLGLQPAVMWWNCKSKSMTMVKSLMQNSRHLAVDQPLHRAHWPPNGLREKPSMKQANWRTQTLLRNSACHRSNYIAQVSNCFNMIVSSWINQANYKSKFSICFVVLAEDAIKAALADYKIKQNTAEKAN